MATKHSLSYITIPFTALFLLVVGVGIWKFVPPSVFQRILPSQGSKPPVREYPKEGAVGEVRSVAVGKDGSITLTLRILSEDTMVEKPYTLPPGTQIKLYSSQTDYTMIPATDVAQGTTVNIMRYENPLRYEVVGISDPSLGNVII